MDDGDNDASVSGAAGGAAARADVSQEGCHVDDNGGDHAGSRATPSSSADNNHTAGAAATGSHSPADLLHRKRQRNSDEVSVTQGCRGCDLSLEHNDVYHSALWQLHSTYTLGY